MRVMVFGMANERAEQGEPPSMAAFEAMERFTEELVEAGVMVAGAGLRPTAQGKRIVFEDGDCSVIDGPFIETKEVIAGFSIWQVKDMAEAVAWAKRSPNFNSGRAELQLRPFFEMEDMGEALNLPVQEAHGGERGRLGIA